MSDLYSPVVVDTVKGEPIRFKYGGFDCVVYESEDGLILPKGTFVNYLYHTLFLAKFLWLRESRKKFVDNVIVLHNLLFDSRNRLATFIYGNSVRATVAFYDYDGKNVLPNRIKYNSHQSQAIVGEIDYTVTQSNDVVGCAREDSKSLMDEILQMFMNECSIFTNYSDFQLFIRTIGVVGFSEVPSLPSCPVVDLYNKLAGSNIDVKTGNDILDNYIRVFSEKYSDRSVFRFKFLESVDVMGELFDSGVELIDADKPVSELLNDELVSELERNVHILSEDLLHRCFNLAKGEISRRTIEGEI